MPLYPTIHTIHPYHTIPTHTIPYHTILHWIQVYILWLYTKITYIPSHKIWDTYVHFMALGIHTIPYHTVHTIHTIPCGIHIGSHSCACSQDSRLSDSQILRLANYMGFLSSVNSDAQDSRFSDYTMIGYILSFPL